MVISSHDPDDDNHSTTIVATKPTPRREKFGSEAAEMSDRGHSPAVMRATDSGPLATSVRRDKSDVWKPNNTAPGGIIDFSVGAREEEVFRQPVPFKFAHYGLMLIVQNFGSPCGDRLRFDFLYSCP
eukprot:Trichotokara_eunicae@DN2317_c0_g1_i1.p1